MSEQVSPPNWVELEGGANTRDVGGLPAGGGRFVTDHALIRSANLQHLTAADVRRLTEELGVRRVIDLRSDGEVERDGPGPLAAQPGVAIVNLSLHRRPVEGGDAQPRVRALVPWTDETASERGPLATAYLKYLVRRPDSVVEALRLIAEPDGATLVHCAAGRDRTGMIVALALSVAGVDPEVIAADYAASASQMPAILTHMARSEQYASEVSTVAEIPEPEPAVMVRTLRAIDEDFGGVAAWLAENGWTAEDTARLRAKLIR
jgi:protein-tyrosine phosphatase